MAPTIHKYGFLLGILLLVFPAPSDASDDLQLWTAYELETNITDKMKIHYNPEFRWRDDVSDFFRHQHRLGIKYNWRPDLTVGGAYFFARNQSGSASWNNENRGEIFVTPKFKWDAWSLSVRNRLEVRQIEKSPEEQEWRYRLMPKVARKMDFAGTPLTLYLSHEFFYEDKRDAWNQGRTKLGVVFPLWKDERYRLKLDLYYMNQALRDAVRKDWSSNQVLGSKLKLEF